MATSSALSLVPTGTHPNQAQASPESLTAQYLEHLLETAIKKQASDIHIHPLKQGLSIRLRVDGLLTQEPPPPRTIVDSLPIRIKAMAGIDIAEKRQPQDGYWMTATRSSPMPVELRISTLPSAYGENIVMRVIHSHAQNPSLPDLGFFDDQAQALLHLLSQPQGLILVTGPTGCGKSVTLYSMLRLLHHSSRHILTIEDPIEQMIEGITQVQVNEKAGLTFQNALRAFLRQDPDVMLIGEIRDKETAAMAIEAAMTGHLVLSTVHTNDACSALLRLEKLGVSKDPLASSLLGVIAQRLVRKYCSACQGKGCSHCGQTGLLGRMAIFETLIMNATLRQHYTQNPSFEPFRQYLYQQKTHQTLMQQALKRVEQGLIPLSEAQHHIAKDSL